MKWIGRFLYIFLVFVIGSYILNFSAMNKRYKYFEENTKEYIENYNREGFLEVFMTASNVKDYLKEPVYLAKDEMNSLEFGLLHGKFTHKSGEGNILFFHFRDISNNIETKLGDPKVYEVDNFKAHILIDIYMDNETKPISDTFQINRKAQMPSSLIEITKDKDGKDIFRYIAVDDAGKQFDGEAKTISKIEITLVDNTKVVTAEDKPVKTPLMLIRTNDDNNNDNETLVKNDDGVLISNNFNGSVDKYLLDELYEVDSNKGKLFFEDIENYNYVVKNAITKFVVVVAIISYLLFFLKPTINYFKTKSLNKASQQEVVTLEETNGDAIVESNNLLIDNNEVLIEEEVNEEIDYSKLTVANLRELAKEKGLSGYSSLKKQELIDLLKDNN